MNREVYFKDYYSNQKHLLKINRHKLKCEDIKYLKSDEDRRKVYFDRLNCIKMSVSNAKTTITFD